MVLDSAFNACCSCCRRRKKTRDDNAAALLRGATPSTTSRFRRQRKIDRTTASKTRTADSRKLQESSSKSRWYHRSKSRENLAKKSSKVKMQQEEANKPPPSMAPPARASFASPIIPSASVDDRMLNRQRMSIDVNAAAAPRRTSALQDAIRASAGLAPLGDAPQPVQLIQPIPPRRTSQQSQQPAVTTIGVISTAAATSTSGIPPLPSSDASAARKGSTSLRPDMAAPPMPIPPPPPSPAPASPSPGLPWPLKRNKSKKSISEAGSIVEADAVSLALADGELPTTSEAGSKSRSKSIGGKIHGAAGKAAHTAHLDQAAGKVASVTHADKAQKAFKTQVVERISRKKSTVTSAEGDVEKIDEETKTSISKTTKIGEDGDDKSDISKLSDASGADDDEDDDSKLAPPKTGLKKITSSLSNYGDAVVDNVTDNPVTNAIDKILIKLKVKKPKPGVAKTRAERLKRRRRKRRRTRRKRKAAAAAAAAGTDDPNAPVKKPKFWQKITKRNKAVATPTEGEGDGKKKKPAEMIKGKLGKATQSMTSVGPLRKLSKKRARSKQKDDDEKEAAAAAVAAAAAAAADDTAAGDNKTVLVVDEKVDKKSTEEQNLTESQLKLKSRRQTKFSKITGAPSVVQTQTLLVKQKASRIIGRKGSKNPDITTTDEDADKEKVELAGKKSLKDKLQARTPSRLRRKKKKSAADAAAADGAGTDTPAATTTDDDEEAKNGATSKKRGLKFMMRDKSKSKASRKSGGGDDETTSAGESSAAKGKLGAAKRSLSKLSMKKGKKATPTLRVSGEDDGRVSTNASTSTRELGILPHVVTEKGGKFAKAAKNMPGKQVGKLMGNKKPDESPSELIQEAQAELIVDKVVVRNSAKGDERRSSAAKSASVVRKSESFQSARTGSAARV